MTRSFSARRVAQNRYEIEALHSTSHHLQQMNAKTIAAIAQDWSGGLRREEQPASWFSTGTVMHIGKGILVMLKHDVDRWTLETGIE